MVSIGLKEHVRLASARPEILIAMQACAEVCANVQVTLVITSICDGKHSIKSLHRFGLAFDVRTRDWPHYVQQEVSKEFQVALGDNYDVVFESDHIHVEYDP